MALSRRRFGGALVALTLAAGACGSSGTSTGAGGDSSAGGGSSTSGVSLTVPQGSSGGDGQALTDPAKLPTDMNGWEALWASQRAAIVKRIKDNKWGVSADGKTLTGPEGFTVDLSKCPSGWSETEGLTDTQITLGETVAQSGTLAYAANYGKGQQTIYDYYSNKGLFTDVNGKNRQINFIQRDDGYDPAKTVPLVDEMLDSDHVFGLTTTGSPNTLKVYDKTNERCVPHLYNLTGHPAWGDPVNHPWTTGLALTYTSEAGLWGKFIENHINEFPNGITVAALIENNDFGNIYQTGFKDWLSSSPIKDKVKFVTEAVDPQAPTITNQMTTIGSKKPDMFIAMVAGTFCTQAVQEADKNGMHTDVKYLFQPDTCAGSTQLSKSKVGGDGTASEGWWIVNGGAKDIRDAAEQQDPVVIWARQMLKDHGFDPDSAAELGLGMIYGWAWVQTLAVAGQLDGGLTRANLILAAWSMDMNNPFLLPGLTFHTDGNKDAFFVEGGVFQQFDVPQQAYLSRSSLFNLDGQTKKCQFDASKNTCITY